jgi:hypothetical protein
MRTSRLLIAVVCGLLASSDSRASDTVALGTISLTLRENVLRVELVEARAGDRALLVIRAELPAEASFAVRAADMPVALPEIAGDGSVVAINGGFYDPSGHAMGLVVENGRVVSPLRRGGGSGVLVHARTGFRVVHRDDVPNDGVLAAVQSIDRIVAGGQSLVGARASPARDARSAVATFRDGSARLYAVFAVDAVASKTCDAAGCSLSLSTASTSTGISLHELSMLMVAEGADAALNLDGGFSTSFEARLGGRRLRVAGFRPTINALIARP